MKNKLTPIEKQELLLILEQRFEHHPERHQNLLWISILEKLENNPEKLLSLYKMEISGGEPDVVDFDFETNEFIFIDCSRESPAGRRSLCYDRKALDSRKKNKPENNAVEIAEKMGVSLLDEQQYRKYHSLVKFDSKTSSWVLTPENIREAGGAIFCDFRYGQVFTYHNGAESYYASRGFRTWIAV